MTSVANLPVDGVPAELLSVHEEEEEEIPDTEDDLPNDTRSFLPFPVAEATEDRTIRSVINDSNRSDWPDINQTPVNEFQTPFLATMAFPTLFPYGRGDPTNPGRQRAVSLTDGLKHLIKYAETTENDQRYWRFASHPRFPYWGLNMKQRHQLLSQANEHP